MELFRSRKKRTLEKTTDCMHYFLVFEFLLFCKIISYQWYLKIAKSRNATFTDALPKTWDDAALSCSHHTRDSSYWLHFTIPNVKQMTLLVNVPWEKMLNVTQCLKSQRFISSQHIYKQHSFQQKTSHRPAADSRFTSLTTETLLWKSPQKCS